ncbi:uncharacterized protein HD556DRAFT_1245930 [Suillus plorans]|uniref:HAT C-terminal dimerisation domain-containing protein n=1 Tax=Suillus plorans TaxID=116603 RepID=A0A9P7AGM4_9AGAM|nr:uncharacterized protein HD556DRAFT_1245930 [Suillus plorans]KAG1787911.1 hypothetical protein HD556DRAFT_1245930 [Suillus plorans]
MLRIEYEKRKVPIANLSISEANTWLKDLIKKYLKKAYPFDRELRTDETAYEWWSYLDKDRSNDAQPLARLAVRIFALVPNSMADERTGSTFTWLNSPLRSRQQVKTLVRTVQIRSWYKHDPNAPPPNKKPTVKWRDMSSTIFGSKRKRTKEDSDDSEMSDVDNDFADELEGPDEDDDDSNSNVTSANPEDIAKDGSSKMDSCNGKSFDAAGIINLDSGRLADVLADKCLAPVAPRNAVILSSESSPVQERVLTEADWDME